MKKISKRDPEFQKQIQFFDPGNQRLCEEDFCKLIGLLALETGRYPMELIPALTKGADLRYANRDLRGLALKAVLKEFKCLLERSEDITKK